MHNDKETPVINEYTAHGAYTSEWIACDINSCLTAYATIMIKQDIQRYHCFSMSYTLNTYVYAFRLLYS